MIQIRRGDDRGRTRLDWLDSRHTFSFGGYRDPQHMGFRALRVLNEDVVAPGRGFGLHPHRDMEILTFVLSGRLEHRDSQGGHGILSHGDVQRMTAGTGIVHSETNPSPNAPVHLLQVWILPDRSGLEPGYEQRTFRSPAGETGKLRLVASPDGRDGSLALHPDASVWVGSLPAGEGTVLPIAPDRHAWLQVSKGELDAGGAALSAGDGLAASGEREIRLDATSPSEILFFDLA